MKKAQKHIAMLIILTILLSIAGISHATGDVTMQLTSNSKLEEGKTVEVSLAITSINAGEGIDTVTAQLNYNQEIFEPVTEESFTGLNHWNFIMYNEDDGAFILSKSSKVDSNSEVLKVELKVKENITVDKAEVSISNIVVSGGDEDIDVDMVSVTIEVPEPTKPTPEEPDTNTEAPDTNTEIPDTNTEIPGTNTEEPAPSTNTQKPTPSEKPKTNTQTPTSNGSVKTNTDKTQTIAQQDNSKSSGTIPQTGTAEDIIFFTIFAAMVIGVVSYIRYRSVSKDIK